MIFVAMKLFVLSETYIMYIEKESSVNNDLIC